MEIHVLNGDSLQERFPVSLKGKQLVCRECMVEGPISAINSLEFYAQRADFIATYYGGERKMYSDQVVTQFDELQGHSEQGEVINLWFEEDVFCQVNFWFLASLLKSATEVYLIRPKKGAEYSFAHMTNEELALAYQHRMPIKAKELQVLSLLWENCQKGDYQNLPEIAKELPEKYDFVHHAAVAYRQGLEQPRQIIRAIADEIGEEGFGAIFKRFHQEAPVYGLGDLQVKRLLES